MRQQHEHNTGRTPSALLLFLAPINLFSTDGASQNLLAARQPEFSGVKEENESSIRLLRALFLNLRFSQFSFEKGNEWHQNLCYL